MIVLLGLIECEGRRTLCGLQAVVGEQASLCGLSRFSSRWRWSLAEVAGTWLRRVMRLIAPDGSRTWLSLSDYAAQLKPAGWQGALWPSQEGGQKVYVHAVQTWIRKLGPTQLQHNLLRWLESQFTAGSTAEQIGAQLAL